MLPLKYPVESLRSSLNALAYFLADHKASVAIVFALTLLSGLMEMLSVGALWPLFYSGAQFLKGSGASNHDSLLSWISPIFGDQDPLATASVLLMIVTAANFALKVFYTYYCQKKIELIYLEAKERIFSSLKNAKYSFYTSVEHGTLLHKSAIAPDCILGVTHELIRGANQLLTSVLLLLLLAYVSPAFFFVLIVAGTMYVLVVKRLIEFLIRRNSREAAHLKQQEMQLLGQFFNGFRPIRLYNAVATWGKRYTWMSRRYALLQRFIVLGFALPGALIQLLLGLGMGLAGLYLAQTVATGDTAILATLGMFVVAANRVNGAISATISHYSAAINQFPNLMAAHQLVTGIESAPAIVDTAESLRFDSAIEFRNVGFTYAGRENRVLEDVSFRISKNRTTAMLGESGGGKSTLLNLVLRLYEPSSGAILIDGKRIETIGFDRYWKLFGLVSQDSFLINGSVKENILFGENYQSEEVIHAARLADAHDFISALPEAYDTVVGENGVQLSGGQKQRLAIARALLRQPPILIFDEPTSSLDSDTEQRIMQTLSRLSGDRTIVIVTHRYSTIKSADEIIMLEGGRVADIGSHDELMSKNERYRRMYASSKA